jgi:HTH DNA binding domain
MPGSPDEEEDDWFRPPWETEEEAELPLSRPARGAAALPNFQHPLLIPLARAQEALTRLETRMETASPVVGEGLRARLSYREASGWLAYAHVPIHPHDLALRDRGVTGSYGAAFRRGRLETEIPATAALESGFAQAPSDIYAGAALRLARLWRRLAELRTWRPLADLETLQGLGVNGTAAAAEIADWFAEIERFEGPLLIRAGRAARDWMNRPGIGPRNPASFFLAACVWRGTRLRPIALPFWAAPEPRHYRLDLHFGLAWMADFLDCVAAAAKIGMDELERLCRIEEKSRGLGRSARSRLQDAVDAALRVPVLTARDLAKLLDISPQAALGLLRQLQEAGIVREATGRISWRAFALA